MKLRVFSTRAALLATVLPLASQAQAALLSHDAFSSYASVAALDDPANLPSPSVAGYTGNWGRVAFGTDGPRLLSGSLSYSDPLYLGSSGDRVGKAADTAGIGAGNSGRLERLLDSSLVTTSSSVGVLYLSFLFQTGNENAAGNANTYQTLALWNGTGGTDGLRDFEAGISGGDFSSPNYSFRADNSTVGNLGVAPNTNTQLFVAKFNLSATAASDSVTVWLNPTLGAEDPTGGVTLTGRDFAFDRLVFSDYASNSANWDEVRFGTTFNAVTVPEPGSALLGGLSAIALLRRRRR